MQKLNQKGFSIVEGILILVIIALIGGIGYYVYSKRDTKPTTNVSQSTTQETTTATPVEADKTADWLVYSVDGGYSIKLADGWILMKKQGNDGSFVGTPNSNLVYTPGIKAVITDYVQQSSPVIGYGLYFDYADGVTDGCISTKVNYIPPFELAFKTASGIDVYTRYSVGDGSQNTTAGDKSYGYCLKPTNDSIIVAGYRVAQNDADHNETVKEVMRTISAN